MRSAFHLIRHDPRCARIDHGEFLLRHSLEYDYDFMILLADDDVLLPSALAYVAEHAGDHKAIATSFWYYDVAKRLLALDNGGGYDLNALIPFPALDFFGHFIETTGIHLVDPAFLHRSRPPIGLTHISAHFLHKSIIKAALDQYGRISVDPFGDIGFFRLGLLAGDSLYLNQPTTVVRFHLSYGVAASAGAQRRASMLKVHHNVQFRFSPVHAITFQNCMLESCLTLINELGFAMTAVSMPFFSFATYRRFCVTGRGR